MGGRLAVVEELGKDTGSCPHPRDGRPPTPRPPISRATALPFQITDTRPLPSQPLRVRPLPVPPQPAASPLPVCSQPPTCPPSPPRFESAPYLRSLLRFEAAPSLPDVQLIPRFRPGTARRDERSTALPPACRQGEAAATARLAATAAAPAQPLPEVPLSAPSSQPAKSGRSSARPLLPSGSRNRKVGAVVAVEIEFFAAASNTAVESPTVPAPAEVARRSLWSPRRRPYLDSTKTENLFVYQTQSVSIHMAPTKRSRNPTPFQDLTNSSITGPDERKNQQRREHYAQMDPHKKEELLKKRLETRKQQKTTAAPVNQPQPQLQTFQECQIETKQSMLSDLQNKNEGDTRSNTENDNPNEDSHWLHTNDSYQRQTDCPCINSSNRDDHKENIPRPALEDPKERKRQYDKERYAQKKVELNRKRSESRRQSKDQIESSRANARAHYANMMPEQKQAKRNHHVLRQDTPSKHSIAKENPTYNPPDVVLPFNAFVPVGSAITVDFASLTQDSDDKNITTKPFVHDDDVEIHVGHRSTRKRRKRVSPGQMPVLVAIRNANFASRCAIQSPQAYGQDVGGSSSVSDGIDVLDPTKQPTGGIDDDNYPATPTRY